MCSPIRREGSAQKACSSRGRRLLFSSSPQIRTGGSRRAASCPVLHLPVTGAGRPGGAGGVPRHHRLRGLQGWGAASLLCPQQRWASGAPLRASFQSTLAPEARSVLQGGRVWTSSYHFGGLRAFIFVQ